MSGTDGVRRGQVGATMTRRDRFDLEAEAFGAAGRS